MILRDAQRAGQAPRPSKCQDGDRIEEALDYARRGWPVVPCYPRSKKPCMRAWQKNTLADPAAVEKWWECRPRDNYGLLLGPRSGVIDIEGDTPEAEHELAELLGPNPPIVPTYRSKRSKHRLFSWTPNLPFPDKAVFHVGAVEIRTGNGDKGAQSLVPASIHPDGPTYTWLVHPDEADPVPFPHAALSRLRDALRESGPATQMTQKNTEEHRTPLASSVPLPRPSAPLCVADAIAATLPTRPGQRRRRVFDLCRHLKAIPEAASAEPSALRPVVVEWHRQCLAVITTKPFSDTWADFLDAWPKVKHPVGQGVIDAAFQRAAAGKPPAKALEMYPGESAALLLASLCRELQRVAGYAPFFLDCRTAGRLIGLHHTTAWRLLATVFQADGILAGGVKGAQATRKANEYRYIGG